MMLLAMHGLQVVVPPADCASRGRVLSVSVIFGAMQVEPFMLDRPKVRELTKRDTGAVNGRSRLTR